MASTSSPDLYNSNPPINPTNNGKKPVKNKITTGLGIPFGNEDHTDCNNPNCSRTTKSSSSIRQSPELPAEQWMGKESTHTTKRDPASLILADAVNNAFRSISQTMVELGVPAHPFNPFNTPPMNQESLPYRLAGQSTNFQKEEPQTEPPTISQLQKDASAKHSTTLTALLEKYLPPALLLPHPSTTPNQPPGPSILDLEVRRAISSARSSVYQNHIPSQVSRDEFRRLVRQSEEENFGHGSQVALAMHRESMSVLTDEKEREEMDRKWNEKTRRREGRGLRFKLGSGLENGGTGSE